MCLFVFVYAIQFITICFCIFVCTRWFDIISFFHSLSIYLSSVDVWVCGWVCTTPHSILGVNFIPDIFFCYSQRYIFIRWIQQIIIILIKCLRWVAHVHVHAHAYRTYQTIRFPLLLFLPLRIYIATTIATHTHTYTN